VVVDCNAPYNGQCDAGLNFGYKLFKIQISKFLEFRQNFNPALAGGIRGAPGIKARLNPRAFQYLSTIFVGILSGRQLYTIIF
jgi:hypothetical protein